MKKLVVLTLVVTLLVTAVGFSGQANAAEKRTLVVSTWGYNQELIDKNITQPFEEMYNVDIVYETGNNSERLGKLLERGDNPGVDVINLAGDYAYQAMQEGVLQPYDPEQLSNLEELYDWAQDPLGDHYGVGYSISSLGLFYRTDEVEEPITSWRDLWREDVAGYVTVPEMGTTQGAAMLLMMALAWGGDADNLEPAWEKLPELVPQLATTYRRSSEMISLVQQEEVWVGAYASYAWGGLLGTELPLEAVVPEEGLAGFLSVTSIVKGTENEDLAHAYIDFLISHDVQLAEALDLVDSPTNATVTEIPEDIAAQLTYGEDVVDSLIFPDYAETAKHKEEWIERWNEIIAQ